VTQDSQQRIALAMVAVFLSIPWLWPFAPGPSTAIVPWLAGATCTIAASVLAGGGFSRTALIALIALVPLAALQAASPLEPAALGGGIVLAGLAAGVGAWALKESRVGVIAGAWWAAAALSTVMALLQYFEFSEMLRPWVSLTEAGTAYANLRQRNQFATLTAIGLAVMLWQARRGASLGLAVRMAVWFGIGNAASASRTGLVEFLALAVLAMAWPGRSRAQAIVVSSALAAYAAAAVILPWLLYVTTGVTSVSLWERVTAAGSCGSRSVLWSNVSHLIAERPWTGWGWGELDFAHFITPYPGARFCDILDNAHDLPLHLAAEFGLPVAALIILLAAAAILRARPWSEADSDRQLAWGVVAVILMHSLLEYPLWYAPFQIAFGLAIGMLWPKDTEMMLHKHRRLLAPVALAIAIGYAAWDYVRVTQLYLPVESRLDAYKEDALPLVRRSWLFREYATFGELTITPLTRANVQWTYDTSMAALHYSPEPRVIAKAIESAMALGHQDVANKLFVRFRAAFPKEHARWFKARTSGESTAETGDSTE
jgi:O-antigen ligase